MEAAEEARAHQAHQEKAQSQGCYIRRGTQTEVSDPANEKVSDGEVRKSPEHVDGRRRQSLTGRLGKGTLKRTTHYAAHEVWNRVAEKSAAEEVRDAMQPFHRESCLSVQKADMQ